MGLLPIEIAVDIPNEDRMQIARDIKAQRDKWAHISEYPIYADETNTPMYYIGSPVYPCQSNKSLYTKKHLDSINTLQHITKYLQPVILEALSKHYNLPIEHLPNASIPGFHIFNNVGKDSEVIIPSFHMDIDILQLFPEVFKGEIVSFVYIVETSNNGDRLDYDGGILEYEENKLYLWSANLLHKIGDVYLETPEDYRITYQGHCIILEGKIYYYW